MIFLLIFTSLQLLLFILLFLSVGNRYKEFINNYGDSFQFAFMAPASLALIDSLHLIERFPRIITGIHQKIIALYGNKHGFIHTKLFLAQLVSLNLLVLFLSSFFGLINQDILIFYFGLFLTVVLTLVSIKGLDKQIKKRQNEILIELPEFLNKVTLLVNAGETIQRAIIRSVEQKKAPEKSFLYKELLLTVNQLKNNELFSQVLEDFSKRCRVQEVSVFTTTVLLNYRRGGGEFVIALRSLAKELWEKKKALTRTLGEQASSKLVFPMVLIFLVVLIIIATPAIMLF